MSIHVKLIFLYLLTFSKIKIYDNIIMSQPPQPAYPAYPAFPAYPHQMPYPSHMPYQQGPGYDSQLMNFIQDSAINQNVTESARNITHDIGQTDRNLTQSINEVNANVSNGVGAVKDTVFASNLGVRSDIGQTDRNLTQSIYGTNANVSNGISAVKDTIYAGNLGVRDLVSSSSNSTQGSVERNGIATNAVLTTMEQASSNRGRDILQAIERTSGESRYSTAVLSAADRQASNDLARDIIAQTNRNTNEIVAGVSAGGIATNTNIAALNVAGSERSRDIMQSLERNAGDTRYTTAVASAADRQLMGDLTRDVIGNISASSVATNVGVAASNVANADRTRDILQAIERNAGESRYATAVSSSADRQVISDLIRDNVMQNNRATSDILSTIASTSVAGVLATTNNGFEVKNLINQGTSQVLSTGAMQYSSLLLENQKSLFETYKMKEVMSNQMADAKYEALKNKEALAAQMAECCCETKMEALKNTERLSAQLAISASESKYEALKNTQLISSQLAECCCEIKEKVGCVYTKLDDTVRILDGNRVRDALSAANNEINLLKAIDYSRRDYPCHRRSRSRSRSPGRR